MRLPEFVRAVRRQVDGPKGTLLGRLGLGTGGADDAHRLLDDYFRHKVWARGIAMPDDQYIPLQLSNFAFRSLTPGTFGCLLSSLPDGERSLVLDGTDPSQAILPDEQAAMAAERGHRTVMGVQQAAHLRRRGIGAIVFRHADVALARNVIDWCVPDVSIDIIVLDGGPPPCAMIPEIIAILTARSTQSHAQTTTITLPPSPSNRGYTHYANITGR